MNDTTSYSSYYSATLAQKDFFNNSKLDVPNPEINSGPYRTAKFVKGDLKGEQNRFSKKIYFVHPLRNQDS